MKTDPTHDRILKTPPFFSWAATKNKMKELESYVNGKIKDQVERKRERERDEDFLRSLTKLFPLLQVNKF